MSPFSSSLITAFTVQLLCQAFKVIYYSLRDGKPKPRYFFSAGGMPSAHSAFVTALSVSVGLRSGFSSDLFAVAAVFSVIIIYDSFRLRGTVEQQGKILKRIAVEHPGMEAGMLPEMVGHTPGEIVIGMAAGGLAALAAYLLTNRF